MPLSSSGQRPRFVGMSYSAFDHLVFAEAREWRKIRAKQAAYARHRNDRQVAALRGLLPHLRGLGTIRAVTRSSPGFFEMGSKHADWFYRFIDEWGAILAPNAFEAKK